MTSYTWCGRSLRAGLGPCPWQKPNRQLLECGPRGFVTRPGTNGDQEILVFTNESYNCSVLTIWRLEGGDDAGDDADYRKYRYSLEAPLQPTDGATGRPYWSLFNDECYHSVYDNASNCVYFKEGRAIMCMDSRNVVTLAAGNVWERGSSDGLGAEARFQSIRSMTTDEHGNLYVMDETAVRKVAVAGGLAQVTTFKSVSAIGTIDCLAYVEASGMLLGTSEDAVYGLQLEAGGADSLSVELIAKRGDSGALGAPYVQGRDDMGGWASVTVDRHGCAYIADNRYRVLWKVDTVTRRVTMLLQHMPPGCWGPRILPSGCLAALAKTSISSTPNCLLIVRDVELEAASSARRSPTPSNPFPNEDLMLAMTPVTVKVGEKRYRAHKELLEQQSKVFKVRLSGGFNESGAAEQELHEVDPDAFAALLQFIYGWELLMPAPLLRPVVVLADYLDASSVVSRLTPRLLAATSPATVAADLLWAEQHNLTELLAGLKAYFLAHASQAMAAAPDSAALLVEGSSVLATELLGALARR